MNGSQRSGIVGRRTILKAGAAIAALQVTSPFIIRARGETPVRIGLVDPLTGVYAAIAQGEVEGAKLAIDQLNKKGGILGRPVELLVEDSTNDVGIGVQKTRKLIERDQVNFIIGDVNSGIAIAMAQVTGVLILKFLCSCFVIADCSAAEALDRCENVVGRFGPSERFWIGVTGLDIGVDRSFQLGSRSMHATFDLLFRQEREETFDLIDPG